MKKEEIILGIDPGTNITGYGLVLKQGQQLSLISLGVMHLSAYSDHPAKLKHIFERTLSLIQQYHPDSLAIEAPFYGKNVQVMLKLGRAQGVAMAAALYRDIPIYEYSPRKIKQSITGNGNAGKEQVAGMLKQLLSFSESPEFLDATDGLAVAVCHAFQNGVPEKVSGKFSGWDAFLKAHPGRKLS